MESVEALQLGLPTLAAISENAHRITVDLEDCFYTISLQSDDCKRFAFSEVVILKSL